MKAFLKRNLKELSKQSTEELLANRYKRFRKIGVFEEQAV